MSHKLTRMTFDSAINELRSSLYPIMDSGVNRTWRSYVQRYASIIPGAYTDAPEYLGRFDDPVLFVDDVPFAMPSMTYGGWSLYGIDYSLTPVLVNSVPQSTGRSNKDCIDWIHSATLACFGCFNGEFETGPLIPAQDTTSGSDQRGLEMPLHMYDASRGLEGLNSKRRNEVRRARELYSRSHVLSISEIPSALWEAQLRQWHGDEYTTLWDLAHGWAWLAACENNQCGIIHHVDLGGQTFAVVGYTQLQADLWRLQSFGVIGPRVNYVGTAALAASLARLSLDKPDIHVVLNNPIAIHRANNDPYEDYKKHFSHYTRPARSLFYSNARSFPPYFNTFHREWVLESSTND